MRTNSFHHRVDVLEVPAKPLAEIRSPLEKTILELLKKGGPDVGEYAQLDRFMEALYLSVQVGLITEGEVEAAKRLFTDEFLNETMHGYGYRQPMGYAGDFLMIDKIYTYQTSGHPHYQKWDLYFHHNQATEAVRNRKDYFKLQLLDKLKERTEPLLLLNVASGPARDLSELYQQIEPSSLKSTCVDLDARAIEHATGICSDYLEHICFHNKNVLRFNTTQKYDVIWSAGLFDYFEDRIFVMAIRRFLSWLKPGGEIIIGNFSNDNSSRGYMELFGEWHLRHRSKEELIELAMQAGVSGDYIHIDQEPLGINLFMRITG